MMEFSVEWGFEDFARFLTSEGVQDDVVSNVIANHVTSVLLVELCDEDLKELAPAVGDRMALRKVRGRVVMVIID